MVGNPEVIHLAGKLASRRGDPRSCRPRCQRPKDHLINGAINSPIVVVVLFCKRSHSRRSTPRAVI